jgi:peptidoglycan/LPS O-acetylase OafA/YrhL
MQSADSTQNPVGTYYRPGLDVVRFIAFLMVYLSHSLPVPPDSRIADHLGPGVAALYEWTFPSWRFGLSLFFTLSAFLIFELLQRERHSTGTVGVKNFYIRRILRIWPLYYLGLALAVAWAFGFADGARDLPALGSFAVFLGSWYITAYGWINNPAMPLWSISVEEQFYLLAPWIAKYCSRRLLFVFCALVVAVANGTIYFFPGALGQEYRTWCNSLVQFECFAAGILLSLCLRGTIPKMHVPARALTFMGAAGSLLVAGNLSNASYSTGANPGSWQLIIAYGLAAVGSSLIVLALLDFRGQHRSLWVIHLGRISYGLYVFHNLVIGLVLKIAGDKMEMNGLHSHVLRGAIDFAVRIAAPLLITWVLAELSYRFFERPFLRLKLRYTVIASQPRDAIKTLAAPAPY